MGNGTGWDGRATLHIHMTSDWHVGRGAGRPGEVDAAVVRDADGFPCIPAKTLVGVWRDRCEELALRLGRGWSAWVPVLFGTEPREAASAPTPPRPAALEVRPARLSPRLRQVLDGPGAASLKAALTLVQPGVQLDRRTDAAMHQHLRFVEVVRAGLTLQASVRLHLEGWTPAQQLGAALLLGGLALICCLGGQRRRGRGECTLELRGIGIPEPAQWLAALRGEAPPCPPPPPPAPPRRTAPASDRPTSSAWVQLHLEITAETPLVVQAEVRGNYIVSQSWIPGTYLLPAVARALEQAGLDPAAIIAAEQLRILPARPLPAPGTAQQPLPTPLTWWMPKEEPVDHVCSAWTGIPQDRRYVRASFPFCVWDGRGAVRAVKPALQHFSHATIDDAVQRPTSVVGGVYTYQALPAGTTLVGELRLRKELWRRLPRDWTDRLQGPLRLGRSAKDDYGLARLTCTPLSAARAGEPPVGDSSCPLPQLGPGTTFTVWLLSPALLRDQALRPAPTPEALARALADAWGVDLQLCPEQSYARPWRQESWQRAWGLPRPSLVGLDAGSCLRLQVTAGQVAEAAVAEVLWEGIGERRVEGFGQLALNHPLPAASDLLLVPKAHQSQGRSGTAPAEDPPLLDPAEPEYGIARILEQALWRERILVRAAALAQNDHVRKEILGLTPEVSRSQANLLRAAVSALRRLGDEQALGSWIGQLRPEGLADRRPQEPWSRLEQLVQEPQAVWQRLQGGEAWPVATADGPQSLAQELWAEAVQALVTACVEAHVRALQAKGG